MSHTLRNGADKKQKKWKFWGKLKNTLKIAENRWKIVCFFPNDDD